MPAAHAALAAVGVFVSSAWPVSVVTSLAPFWLDQLGVGDALVTIFCGASIAAGALVAIARHRANENSVMSSVV